MKITKRSFKGLFMAAVLCCMTAACGGGGGGGGGGAGTAAGDDSKLSVIQGVVSDGPIKNARVFLDINYNGNYDSGEPFAITNDKGEYRITYLMAPGTQYLLIAEGSQTLKTSDPIDNPDDVDKLTFTMFTKVVSVGTRNADPVPYTYIQDITPVTFKNYLKEMDTTVGGIDNATVKAIIDSTSSSTIIFKELIKSQDQLQNFAVQAAEVIKYIDSRATVQSAIGTAIASSNATISFTTSTSNPLIDKLLTNTNSTAVIGDMVISKPVAAPTTADVPIPNIIAMTPAVTFTVKPGSLTAHNVSVTPYASVLEIPEFANLRDNGTVALGGDINAKSGGVRSYVQTLGYSAVFSTGVFTDLQYFYFNGTKWKDGGALTASGMTFYSAPFVIIKKDSKINKTLNVDGLSLLTDPVVVVKGYDDATKTVVTIDAVVVTQNANNVTVQVPANFVILEIVIIDNELAKITADSRPSVSIPVTDTAQTNVVNTSLSTTTKFIATQTLYDALRNGSTPHYFTGLGSYIDTKVIFRGIDLPNALKTKIDYALLDNSASAGETINITEADATGSIIWTFEPNKVVRTYEKRYTGGEKNGSVYTSTYTFSNTNIYDKLTNVSFRESAREMTNNVRTLAASYEGVAVFNKETGALQSARFYQSLSEFNPVSGKTNSANGIATIEEGSKLTFEGRYAFNLTAYGEVKGSVTLRDAAVAKGNIGDEYFNYNTIDHNSVVIFSSQSDYSAYVPLTNPGELIGIWGGTFTDNCGSAENGRIVVAITDTTATWWGASADMSRNYGTIVEINGDNVVLKNDTTVWSTGTLTLSGDAINGNWSSGACQGSYTLTK